MEPPSISTFRILLIWVWAELDGEIRGREVRPFNRHPSSPLGVLKVTQCFWCCNVVRKEVARPITDRIEISHFEGSKLYQRGPFR